MDARQSLRSTFVAIQADLEAIRTHQGRLGSSIFPNFAAVIGYRVARLLRTRGLPRLAAAIAALTHALTGSEISPQADIGPGLHLVHTTGNVVGAGIRAGRALTLYGGVVLGSTRYDSRSRRPEGVPIIGDGVTCYVKSSVIGPVCIESGVIVGAHALVMSDMPAGAYAKGVPARPS